MRAEPLPRRWLAINYWKFRLFTLKQPLRDNMGDVTFSLYRSIECHLIEQRRRTEAYNWLYVFWL